MSDKEQAFLTANKQLIEYKNIEILKQCMGPVVQKIEAKGYVNNPEQYNEDIREASKKFNQRAKGENKGEILAEFMTDINSLFFGMNNK